MAQADVIFSLGADVGQALDALKRAERALEDVGNSTARPAQQVGVLQTQFNDFAAAAGGSWKSAIGGLGAAFGGMFAATAVIGGIKALAGALSDFSAKSISAAVEAEDSTNRLRSALMAQGAASDHNLAALNRMADGLQRVTRYDDEAIRSVQALGLNIGVNAAQLPKFTQAAVDMAAALRMDLNDAGKQLAMTLDGNAGQLKQLIPELAGMSAETMKAGGALDAVAAKFRGMAEQDAKTLGGSLDLLKNMAGEAAESFGMGFAGKAGLAGSARDMASAIDSALPKIAAIAGALGGLAEKALNAANELAAVFATDTNALADTFEGKVIEQQRALTDLGVALDRVTQQREDFVSSKGMLWKGDRAVLEGSGQAKAYDAQIEILKAQITEGQRVLSALRADARSSGGAKQNAITEGTVTPASGMDAAALSGFAKLKQDIDDYAASADHAMAVIGDVGLSLQDQAAVVQSVDKAGQSLRSSLMAMLLDPQAPAAEIKAKLEELAATMARASAAGSGITSGALFERRQDEMAAGGGIVDFMSADATTMQGPGAADFAAGDDAMADREAQRERDFEFMMLMIDGNTDLNEVIAAQADVYALLSDRQKQLLANREMEIQRTGNARAAHQMMGAALQQTAGAFVEMAIAGEISGRKLLQVTLQTLSQLAQQKMIEQIALAWAAIGSHGASGNPAAHFASAAMWGGIAIGAGVAAGAVGGSGGGEDGRSSREFGDGMGTSSRDRATRDAATSGGQSGPTIQVSFNGPVTSAGGPEELARLLHAEVRRLESDTSGRSGSRIL